MMERTCIVAVICKQLLMRSVFDNPAVIHNQDLISVFNGRNTVGDDEDRALAV